VRKKHDKRKSEAPGAEGTEQAKEEMGANKKSDQQASKIGFLFCFRFFPRKEGRARRSTFPRLPQERKDRHERV